jgi:hypothetical protein
MTYNVPWVPWCSDQASMGGLSFMDTAGSLWRRTGVMRVNEFGVEPVKWLCSSGETKAGRDVMSVAMAVT